MYENFKAKEKKNASQCKVIYECIKYINIKPNKNI